MDTLNLSFVKNHDYSYDTWVKYQTEELEQKYCKPDCEDWYNYYLRECATYAVDCSGDWLRKPRDMVEVKACHAALKTVRENYCKKHPNVMPFCKQFVKTTTVAPATCPSPTTSTSSDCSSVSYLAFGGSAILLLVSIVILLITCRRRKDPNQTQNQNMEMGTTGSTHKKKKKKEEQTTGTTTNTTNN